MSVKRELAIDVFILFIFSHLHVLSFMCYQFILYDLNYFAGDKQRMFTQLMEILIRIV